MSYYQQQPRPNVGYLNTCISWGAGIVIIGLMFKILHWPGGEIMIGVGLASVALMFFILGFASMPGKKSTTNGTLPGNTDQVLSTDKAAIARFNTTELQNYDAELKRQSNRIEELSTAISMREGELKIAKKLKEANVSYDIISKSTGLSTEEIVKL
jgi:hypothetical protein